MPNRGQQKYEQTVRENEAMLKELKNLGHEIIAITIEQFGVPGIKFPSLEASR